MSGPPEVCLSGGGPQQAAGTGPGVPVEPPAAVGTDSLPNGDSRCGAGGRRAGGRAAVPSPEEWGREQAARAPRWSAQQRAHAAGLFGLARPGPGGGR